MGCLERAQAQRVSAHGTTVLRDLPASPSVIVVAAFHQPAIELARRQVESLHKQAGVNLSCIAVLDGAETAAQAELVALLADAGFQVIAHASAQGIRAAFAAGLRQALAVTGERDTYFAYCDQDDVWHPTKLSACIAAAKTAGASLAHCDARVVSESGELIAPSLHAYESRREPDDLLGMLMLNTVTGMTAVFPRTTAELAVRLMDRYQGPLLHDHVTSVAAASLGPVTYVAEPLVDYVQHDENRIGAKARGAWRARAIGWGHVTAYRQTSMRIFAERRELGEALAEEGRLPPRLAKMLRIGKDTGRLSRFILYAGSILPLLAKGRWRHAELCLRLMDSALWRRQPPSR
jgi:glycosyltransferase involved in cell wall biosynthesis